jgi:hypothetical protein
VPWVEAFKYASPAYGSPVEVEQAMRWYCRQTLSRESGSAASTCVIH